MANTNLDGSGVAVTAGALAKYADATGNKLAEATLANLRTLLGIEYGTWTPTIGGATVAGTQTYAVQTGMYAKIDNVVLFWCRVTITAKDAATAGALRIFGLPYTAMAATGNPWGCNVASVGQLDLDAGYSMFTAVVGSTSANILIQESGDLIANFSVDSVNLQATTTIGVAGSYRTA